MFHIVPVQRAIDRSLAWRMSLTAHPRHKALTAGEKHLSPQQIKLLKRFSSLPTKRFLPYANGVKLELPPWRRTLTFNITASRYFFEVRIEKKNEGVHHKVTDRPAGVDHRAHAWGNLMKRKKLIKLSHSSLPAELSWAEFSCYTFWVIITLINVNERSTPTDRAI